MVQSIKHWRLHGRYVVHTMQTHTFTDGGKQPKKLRSCLINPIQCSWFWWSRQSPWPAFLHCNNSCINESKTLHCSLCPVQIVSHEDSFHRLICNATCSFYAIRYILYLITSLDNLQSCVVTAVVVKLNSSFVCLSVCSNVQSGQEASSLLVAVSRNLTVGILYILMPEKDLVLLQLIISESWI